MKFYYLCPVGCLSLPESANRAGSESCFFPLWSTHQYQRKNMNKLISRLSWLCNFLHSDFRRLPIVVLSSIFYSDLVYCAMPHCFLLGSTWYLKNFSSLLTHLFIFFGCQAGGRPHEATWGHMTSIFQKTLSKVLALEAWSRAYKPE